MAAQAATVVLTWALWQDRSDPPLLPILDGLPTAAWGWPMLLSLALASWRRRPGTLLHVGVLAYGLSLDQTRLQPEFVSLAILMVAVAFPGARVLGRAHLATLWAWSGLHKLLSTGFATGGAVFIANGLPVPVVLARWLAPVSEVVLGGLALNRRTRPLAIAMAFAVHGAILTTLVRQGWNTAVWPWNAALPVAAAHLLSSGEGLPAAEPSAPGRAWTRASIVTVLVWVVAWTYPAGFYVGAADTYLAHNLYTSNTRQAAVCADTPHMRHAPTGCSDPFRSAWSELNVPLPPETRLYRHWFEATCSAGEVLRVEPIRTRLTVGDPSSYPCPTPAPG